MLETKASLANLSPSHTHTTLQVRLTDKFTAGSRRRIKDEQEMFDIRSKLYSVRFKPWMFIFIFFFARLKLYLFCIQESKKNNCTTPQGWQRESFCRPLKSVLIFLSGAGPVCDLEVFELFSRYFICKYKQVLNPGCSQYHQYRLFPPGDFFCRVLCAALHRLQMIRLGLLTTPSLRTSRPSATLVSLRNIQQAGDFPVFRFDFVFLEMVKKPNKFTW